MDHPVTQKGVLETLGLGHGCVGVIMARAGVGKTACLVHLAVGKLLAGDKVAHISIDENPQRVEAWYDEIKRNMCRQYRTDYVQPFLTGIDERKVIITYPAASFSVGRIGESLQNLRVQLDFEPAMVVVDNLALDSVDSDLIEGFRALASDNNCEVWFSVVCSRRPDGTDDDLGKMLDAVIYLDPAPPLIALRVLKGPGRLKGSAGELRLNPRTMLLETVD